MKTRQAPVWLALLSSAATIIQAHAQSTAFTYQGRLNDGSASASGIYDLRFTIYDSSGGLTVVAGPLTNSAAVSNGLFSAGLDFGSNVFTGPDRWLEIAVRTNGSGVFTTLTSRQELTASPYALHARTASMVASNAVGTTGIQNGAVTAAKLGSGAALANILSSDGTGSGLDADRLDGQDSSSFWNIGGNVGTFDGSHFVGTADNQPLDFRVNGTRALRLEPHVNGPNVIGGDSANVVSNGIYGATIAGGGYSSGGNRIFASSGTIGGGYNNRVGGFAATIAGGAGNQALNDNAFIGGGNGNTNSGYMAVIGGGYQNAVSGFYSVIAGGIQNENTNNFTGIGGGTGNKTRADYSAIGGGRDNATLGQWSFIGGGRINETKADYATVVGGTGNEAGEAAFVGGGHANRAYGRNAAIAGGDENQALTNGAAIGGGTENVVRGPSGVIGGGLRNVVLSESATIAGGQELTISNSSLYATISGGWRNHIGTNSVSAIIGGGQENNIFSNSSYATIAGGRGNCAGGTASFAAGYVAEAIHDHSFVWSDGAAGIFTSTSSNQFLISAKGGVGIGTAGPVRALDVRDGSGAAGDGGSIHVGGTGFNGDAKFIYFGDGNFCRIGENVTDDRMELRAATFEFLNGAVGLGRAAGANKLEIEGEASKTTAGGWLANSDRRIKTDVQTITGALDKLAQVRLVQFRYTDEYRAAHPTLADRSYLNVVAQEFQKVFPENVKSSGEKLANGEDILQVDTYPLTIYTASAVQELNRKVEQQRAENAELKRELAEIKKLLQQFTQHFAEVPDKEY